MRRQVRSNLGWGNGVAVLVACGLLLGLVLVGPASAANIAFVSASPTDGSAPPDAASQGYTSAVDQGYVDLLTNAGHTVTRYLTQSPDQAFIDTLATNDLVVVSRQVGSGDFQDAPEVALWSSLPKPTIYMSGYIVRANRLQLMSGNTIPDTGAGDPPVAGPVTLTAQVPGHPIFDGITLDGSNNMDFADYPVTTPMGVTMRGISAVTEPPAGGGTTLATVGNAGELASGASLIAYWPAGDTLGANVLAAPRMTFLSGTREPTSPNPLVLAGEFDLTAAGSDLFLNAVGFMAIPEPSSALLVLISGLVLGMVRTKR